MDRRQFLVTLGAASTLTLAACASPEPLPRPPVTGPTTDAAPDPRPLPDRLPAPTPVARPAPQIPKVVPAVGEPVFELPIQGDYMAWTVDDGGDPETIRRYAEMAHESGTRLTFFPNGVYDGWEQNADLLRPLVSSGQVVIGNHTWSHASLTSLSDQGIVDELTRNDDYLGGLFGMSTKPFYRPPFGYRDSRTDAVAAEIGFTVPVMWYGSLSDSGLITEAQVTDFATQWFLAGHIVIGHANYPSVCNVFPQLLQLLSDRGLQTVTMRDVYEV